MSKYTFERLDPLQFESLVKALIDDRFRTSGELTQFGPGRDGGREATWVQQPSHQQYSRPGNADADVPRQWVFQAKYHDHTGGRARVATAQLVEDLDAELEKLVGRYKTSVHTFVLITNASVSGVHAVGGRDRLKQRITRWREQVDRIEVWDAADLSAMIDCAPGVRRTFLDQILPGDLLAALLRKVDCSTRPLVGVLRAYLTKAMQLAGAARTDEAGDENERQLKLEQVYIDLTVEPQINGSVAGTPVLDVRPDDSCEPSASFSASQALLLCSGPVSLLQAGPGYGKSTISQFLTAWHAARSVDPERAKQLATRMELGEITYEQLDSRCRRRVPFRVELRRYAEFRGTRNDGLASYIADQLISPNADATYRRDDVYDLISRDPCLVILDGLDEVPNTELRKQIVQDADLFLNRCNSIPEADVALIVSTRPQGYHGEFDCLVNSRFTIRDLTPKQFACYRDDWLKQRILDCQERRDALLRVDQGMASPDVARLASTLLQATVILTIARNKHDIPHERSSLFSRYVEVIFQREMNKHALVKRYEAELRRLHEQIAYSLHCSMERGASGSMSEAEFRNEVLRVWATYRGTEPLDQGVRPLVDQLVEAARDRLVFLRGEGADQSEVGFLLSSFREFFAASYLHQHEEAERDRVFKALFDREWHWENVLLFYAGLQETSDQKSWLGHVAESNFTSHAERVLETVRFRRALLKLLPEFRNLKLVTFQRAIKEIFASETLWAWKEAQWAAPIVRSVRGGTAVGCVIDRLVLALDGSPSIRATAIDLAFRILEPRSQEAVVFEKGLADKCTDLHTARMACVAAIENDYPFSIPGDHIETWRWGVEIARRHGPPLRRLLPSLPPGLVADSFVRDRWRGLALFDNHADAVALKDLLGHGRLLTNGGEVGVSIGLELFPFLAGWRDCNWESMAACSASWPAPVRGYWLALQNALRCPGDLASYEAAASAARGLNVSQEFTVGEWLGPAPSEFASPREWERFATLAAATRTNREMFRVFSEPFSEAAKPNEAALVFALHPSVWHCLSDVGLISAERMRALEMSPAAEILGIPQRAIRPGRFVRLGGSTSAEYARLDPGQFVQAAVSAAKKQGARVLATIDLRILLGQSDLRRHTNVALVRDAFDLLRAQGWRDLALLFGLLCETASVREIEEFWRACFRSEPPYQFRTIDDGDVTEFVARICESEHGQDFKLWFLAWFGTPYSGVKAETLAGAAVTTALSNTGELRRCGLRALLSLPWVPSAMDVWRAVGKAQPQTAVEAFLSRRAIDKIFGPPASLMGIGQNVAEEMVVSAADLPAGFGFGAFLRLAGIRKGLMSKLEDSDWQRAHE